MCTGRKNGMLHDTAHPAASRYTVTLLATHLRPLGLSEQAGLGYDISGITKLKA